MKTLQLNISCFVNEKIKFAKKEFSGFFEHKGHWFGFFVDCNLWNCTHIQTGAAVKCDYTKAAAKNAAINEIEKDSVKFNVMVSAVLAKHGEANDMQKFLKLRGK